MKTLSELESSPIISKLNSLKIIRDRELGFKKYLGYDDDLSKLVYHNIDVAKRNKSKSDKDVQQVDDTSAGGIFNLEFSADGDILVAACEGKSILLYDAGNQKLIKQIDKAHSNCVNCVRFFGPHSFATCSDDKTIKIWDTRQLKMCLRTLLGHSNWVKSIEYSSKEKKIISSAFDGSIHSWDISCEDYNNYDRVFSMCGLMRTRLTPDSSKMIICTTSGYIIIIHDVNFATLSKDMETFKPNLYRLMQISEQSFPAATAFNHLFSVHRKSNRFEIVGDFPSDAEVISSLQIHPMGWSSLSRYVSYNDQSEYTVVHDVQTRDPDEYKDAYIICENPPIPDQNRAVPNVQQLDAPPRMPPRDIWMRVSTNARSLVHRMVGRPTDVNTQENMLLINSGLLRNPNLLTELNVQRRMAMSAAENVETLDYRKIITTIPRLTHYVEEPNVGRGYIKELCFSSDGRIVCSPYECGVRLLGFNEHLQELSYCVPNEAQVLKEFAVKKYHPNLAVCCKFNPRHYQLVSGCLGGTIVWYKPIL